MLVKCAEDFEGKGRRRYGNAWPREQKEEVEESLVLFENGGFSAKGQLPKSMCVGQRNRTDVDVEVQGVGRVEAGVLWLSGCIERENGRCFSGHGFDGRHLFFRRTATDCCCLRKKGNGSGGSVFRV